MVGMIDVGPFRARRGGMVLIGVGDEEGMWGRRGRKTVIGLRCWVMRSVVVALNKN